MELLLVLTMLGAGLLATTGEFQIGSLFFLGMSLAPLRFVQTKKKNLQTKHEFKNR